MRGIFNITRYGLGIVEIDFEEHNATWAEVSIL